MFALCFSFSLFLIFFQNFTSEYYIYIIPHFLSLLNYIYVCVCVFMYMYMFINAI